MICAYCAERILVRRMVPLVLLLTAAAQAGRASTIASIGADAAIAFLLAAQFRIWDDLADRDHDAVWHPDRVLVRATTIGRLKALCAGLSVMTTTAITLRSASLTALVALIALYAAMSVCYTARNGRTLVTDHLLLARYAGFVFVISTSSGPAAALPLALAMTAVFLTMSVYEGVHDRTSPIAARPKILAGESVLLAGTLVVLGGQL